MIGVIEGKGRRERERHTHTHRERERERRDRERDLEDEPVTLGSQTLTSGVNQVIQRVPSRTK